MDDGGEFGGDGLNILDVTDVFVTSLQPTPPVPVNSDRFSAMDSNPEDAPPTCGGNGTLDILDVTDCFVRSLVPGSTRYERDRSAAPTCVSSVIGGGGSAAETVRSTRSERGWYRARRQPFAAVVIAGGPAVEAGTTVELPVRMRLLRGPLLGAARLAQAQFAVGITPVGDAPAVVGAPQFHAAAAMPEPDLGLVHDKRLLLGWLQSWELEAQRVVTLGTVRVAIPASAVSGDTYLVTVEAPSLASDQRILVPAGGTTSLLRVGTADVLGRPSARMHCAPRRLLVGESGQCDVNHEEGLAWLADPPGTLSVEPNEDGATIRGMRAGRARVYAVDSRGWIRRAATILVRDESPPEKDGG